MSVDSEMYEAAELDGANKFQQFVHIILPSIKTIVTLNVILSITGALSAFEQPFVITGGSKGNGNVFYQHEQYCTYQPEGRTRVGDGGCVTSYHFRMYDLTETVL